MREPGNNQAVDRRLSALFAGADPSPKDGHEFATRVMKRIRRRERIRWLLLGGSIFVAALLAGPAISEFSGSWAGVDFSMLDGFRTAINEVMAPAGEFLRSAVRSMTFLAAATLAAAIVPLLRWLED